MRFRYSKGYRSIWNLISKQSAMEFEICIIFLAFYVILICTQEITYRTFSKTEFTNQMPDNNSRSLFDLESANVIYCAAHCSQTTDCHSVFHLKTQRSCRGYSSLTLRTANFTNETNVNQFIMSNTEQGCNVSGFTAILLRDNSSICIKIIDKAAQWSKSRELCQAENADLAILNTDEKLSLVFEYIKQHYATMHWWIWLTDLAIEGTWRWKDNSVLNVSSSRQEFNGGALENCGIFRVQHGGMVTDEWCAVMRGGICQK